MPYSELLVPPRTQGQKIERRSGKQGPCLEEGPVLGLILGPVLGSSSCLLCGYTLWKQSRARCLRSFSKQAQRGTGGWQQVVVGGGGIRGGTKGGAIFRAETDTAGGRQNLKRQHSQANKKYHE
jgi:hypothetical protein